MPPDVTETNGTTTGAEGAALPDKAHAGLIEDLRRTRERAQAAEAKATALEAAQAAAAQKAAEEAGQHKALYDGIKPKYDEATAELARLRAERQAEQDAIASRNVERAAALPEDLRDLVPEGLTPAATQAQIERLEARARKVDPTFARGSKAGATAEKPGIPPECKAEAQSNGRDPQWWFDNVWNSPARVKRRAAKT